MQPEINQAAIDEFIARAKRDGMSPEEFQRGLDLLLGTVEPPSSKESVSLERIHSMAERIRNVV